jgi:restriction endonuclease-like protein
MQAVADRWSGRGVPGSGTLTEALAERCDRGLPRSWFERMARKSFREHGIDLRHEVPVIDGRKRIAFLDLAEVDLKVGVECQSWAWHATPAARQADARRKRRLRRLGWDITELWWSDRQRMHDAVADVVEALERQRILLCR